MKPGHWLILGSATTGCAAAFGIYLAAKGSSPADRTPQAASPRMQPASGSNHSFAIPKSVGSHAARVSESGRDTAQTSTEFHIHGKPTAGRAIDERAWFASAERIGHQANRELEKLRETLELSPNQQQRIFDILAQNSPSWQPGMLTGGSHGVGVVSDGRKTNGPSDQTPEPAVQIGDNSNGVEAAPVLAMNEEVMAVLDADQQQALMEEEINRRAWWEEILPQLLAPEFPVAAGVDDPAASLPGNGDTKAYQGPTEILEE